MSTIGRTGRVLPVILVTGVVIAADRRALAPGATDITRAAVVVELGVWR